MAERANTGEERPLRAHLQAGTRTVHDRLDRSVADLDFLRFASYARFLACQLEARDGIEEWADRHCPGLLRPPCMTGLLRADLADLATDPAGGMDEDSESAWAGGHTLSPALARPFVLPAGADPLGLAWAVAGSHLGNRAILARMRGAIAAGTRPALPSRFLADTRMTGFWHRLLPRLQDRMSAEQADPALAAARAVFARFDQAFTSPGARCKQAA